MNNGIIKNKLIGIAHWAIQKKLSGESVIDEIEKFKFEHSFEELNKSTGIFVTLWKNDKQSQKQLRGCIGRHQRRFDNIIEEVMDCAIMSALEDDRFAPVELLELSQIKIEISLLSAPEKINSLEDLNPNRFGIIVKSGFRSATLLPEIDGIDSVQKQFLTVCRKAGISPNEIMDMFRFEVRKVTE